MVRFVRIKEARRLAHVDRLVEITMEKGVFDIQFSKRPFVGHRKRERENNPYCSKLDYRAKGFMIVNPRLLMEVFGYKTSLIP